MEPLQRLRANYEAEDHRFLYDLHEETCFQEAAFSALCDCMISLSHTHPNDQTVAFQLVFLYGQVLQHIIYHFDSNDLSRISNLPPDYAEKLACLQSCVMQYFHARPG